MSGKMSGNKCSYYSCNNSKYLNPSIRMHSFPKEEDRRNVWIINSGNASLLTLSEDKLRKKFLCSKHFLKESYTNPGEKGRLLYNAVPIKYVYNNQYTDNQPTDKQSSDNQSTNNQSTDKQSTNNQSTDKQPTDNQSADKQSSDNQSTDNQFTETYKVLTPKKVYTPKFPSNRRYEHFVTSFEDLNSTCMESSSSTNISDFVRDIISLPDPPVIVRRTRQRLLEDASQIKKIKAELKKAKRKLRAKMALIEKLRSKKTPKNNESFESKISRLPKNSQVILLMQIKGLKGRKDWSLAEKRLAMKIFYKSPGAYSVMRKNGIILPGESTVRSWLHSATSFTGLNKQFIKQLTDLASNLKPMEKKCVLLFEEMTAMKLLEYNKTLGTIEGFEDLDDLGRANKLTGHAVVVMTRGLYSEWKMPLSYHLSNAAVQPEELAKIIEESVNALTNCGLIPKIILCVQKSNTRKLYSMWGVNANSPTVDIGEISLFCMYDVPHLMKALRNNLLNDDFCVSDQLISITHVKDAFAADVRNKSNRMMPKISPTHLNRNNLKKTNCKFAIQLFSQSVSDALRFYLKTGDITDPAAVYTADFFSFINNIFDSLNSSDLHDCNPNKRPLSEMNPQIFENLEEGEKVFQVLQKIGSNGKVNTRPPCFEGFLLSIATVRHLYFEEKDNNLVPVNEYFLMTRRLTQDPLEDFFSYVYNENIIE